MTSQSQHLSTTEKQSKANLSKFGKKEESLHKRNSLKKKKNIFIKLQKQDRKKEENNSKNIVQRENTK